LLDAMRKVRATGTWLYREALEVAAVSSAVANPSTDGAQALEPWTLPAGPPRAPSAAARADSLLRRAAALRALNRRDEMRSLSAEIERTLAHEPSDSPRRVAWRRLSDAG
jgi:hypothetical protein